MGSGLLKSLIDGVLACVANYPGLEVQPHILTQSTFVPSPPGRSRCNQSRSRAPIWKILGVTVFPHWLYFPKPPAGLMWEY